MDAKKYNQINALLAEYSKTNAALEEAEAKIKTRQLTAASTLLPTHAKLKVRLDEIESALLKLSDANYDELFPDENKRNHKTPFGELTYRKSSCIDFDDAEKVLLKIKLECRREHELAARENRAPRFQESQLIRTHEEPNLATLGTYDEALLSLFGLKRVSDDNFKVKPFTMKSDKPGKKAKAEVVA